KNVPDHPLPPANSNVPSVVTSPPQTENVNAENDNNGTQNVNAKISKQPVPVQSTKLSDNTTTTAKTEAVKPVKNPASSSSESSTIGLKVCSSGNSYRIVPRSRSMKIRDYLSWILGVAREVIWESGRNSRRFRLMLAWTL